MPLIQTRNVNGEKRKGVSESRWRKTSSSIYLNFAWRSDPSPASPRPPPLHHPRNALTDFEIPTDLEVYSYLIHLK